VGHIAKWLVIFIGFAPFAMPAHAAGTAQASFTVTATVLASCIVSSAGSLGFGNYTASSATPTDAQTSIDVTCSNGLGYTIALDGGGTSDPAARAMSDGTDDLTYTLCTDNSYGTIWGDGTSGTSTQSGTGSGAAQNYPIYGRIPVGQYVGAGAGYTDTINVTVTY
jgi:spore coat protein U-like protein